MRYLLPLLCCVLACTATPAEQKVPGKDHTADTAVNTARPLDAAVESTASPKFSSLEEFLDSSGKVADGIHKFSRSWYAFAYQDFYKGFQQFGVVFPFEYVVQDSIGAEKTFNFNSIGEITQWRTSQFAGMNAWSVAHSGSPQRLVWEGYPEATYGNTRYDHLPYDLETDTGMVTYLYPMNKVDYFFRKDQGIWRVFKRVQKKYSQSDLQKAGEASFEGFLLRFISDVPFRMKSIKWPLRTLDSPVGEGIAKISYLKKSESNYLDRAYYRPIMRVNSKSPKKRMGNDTMYTHSMSEGGVSRGEIFTKVNRRWTLIEMWDASN